MLHVAVLAATIDGTLNEGVFINGNVGLGSQA